MDLNNLDETLQSIQKEWKRQKIEILQGVLDDHNITNENVKERCRMEVVAETREERLFIDEKLVITIRDMGWHKHYDQRSEGLK